MARFAMICVIFVMTTFSAQAGKIKSACLSSDRSVASRSLCNCIQGAADVTLSSRDQSLAASFFDDPDRAQRIRQSDSRQHEVFWERYESFGRLAERSCKR